MPESMKNLGVTIHLTISKYVRNMDSPLLGILFTAPVILLIIVLLFIPMVNSIYLSMIDTSLTNPAPKFIGLSGYAKLFSNKNTFNVILNSFIWTLLVSSFQFIVGLASALILNNNFRGRIFVRSIIVLPWVLPGVVAAMGWRLFYDAQLGFLNNILIKIGILNEYVDWLGMPKLAMSAVIVTAIWKGFGFSMLMYLAALQTVPIDHYEAARIDGANAIQQFFHITIPGISGVIRTTLLLTCIWTFNYFEIIYVMTGGGPIRSTHIAPTFIYELAFRNFNLGEASRFAVLSFILVSIVSIVYIRELKKREVF